MRNRTRLTPLLSVITAGLVIAAGLLIGSTTAPRPATAAEVLDQSFEPGPVTEGVVVEQDSAPAQSFVAGQSGRLTRAAVLLRAVGTPGDLIVEIHATTGTPAKPTETVLANATVPQSAVPVAAGWVEVTFASAPMITAGTAYAIVLRAPAAAIPNYPVWFYNPTGGYPSGGRFSFVSGVWMGPFIMDHYFRTYVDAPAPPPILGRLPMTVTGTVSDPNGPLITRTQVRAFIGETLCGTSNLTLLGALVLVVNSAAQTPGCGTPGAAVRFEVGSATATATPPVTFQSGGVAITRLQAAKSP